MMKVVKYPPRGQWSGLLQRPVLDSSSLENTVAAVLKDVKENGDAAVKIYTERFDKVPLQNPEVSTKEFTTAGKLVPDELKEAVRKASKNIEKFHSSQKETVKVIETMKGVSCWRKSVAIERIGLYIPGGSAPLFSTILMLVVPAQLAGCKEIILCTPPDAQGNINPAILYAAKFVGITKVFKVGGAQAIAAMAYGTESIPKVYKIFGPGNQYVTCAKQLVSKEGVAIDMPAGPSEVVVWADESCVSEFVAADLLSQAEHGPDSQVMLVSTSETMVEIINNEIARQLKDLPRRKIAEKALINSKAIIVKDNNEALDLINEYAPEHLIISCIDHEALAEKVINAGSVFLGNYSPESVGDYASGTNHTLPTNGYAKAYSGVSLDSFVKKITFQKLTKEGVKNIGSVVEQLAAAEGLQAHKNAVTVRMKN
jgi:histidinol dehydrogenase